MMRRLFRSISTITLLLSACTGRATQTPVPVMPMDPGMMDRHMAPIPDEYAGLTNPLTADDDSLARGQALYEAKCAVCHGQGGWGDGPAAADLNPPPAPLAHTAPMMSDAYLFYRISEGGGFAPFNSAMPAWKGELTENERWDVINYARSLVGDVMMGGGSMMNGMPAWMWMGTLLGGLLVLGLVAALAGAIVWVARRARPVQSAERPLEILKRRLASGEITLEQFEAMTRQLEEPWASEGPR